jgi:hypothetical protein
MPGCWQMSGKSKGESFGVRPEIVTGYVVTVERSIS